MSDSDDPRALKLIDAARAIIRETGTFDLPMRQLAARAQVSLRTPYEIFGSKSGIIIAILRSDQAIFGEIAKRLKSQDILNGLFDRVMASMEFYTHQQPFYRALFRATQGYSGAGGSEPVREVLPIYTDLCLRGREAGHLRPDIDPAMLAGTLTDIFAANLRHWALSDFDIILTGNRVCYGHATVLAGTVADPWADMMRTRMGEFQRAVRALETAENARAAAAEEQVKA